MGDSKFLRGMREVNGGSGYCSMSSTIVHFGADSTKAYDARIVFPASGIEVVKKNIAAGQTLTVFEERGLARWRSTAARLMIRAVRNPETHFDAAKLTVLFAAMMGAVMFYRKRSWWRRETLFSVFVVPAVTYIVFNLLGAGRTFLISEVLPEAVAMASLGVVLLLASKFPRPANGQQSFESLYMAMSAFDHGEWASSNLNRLALFSINLTPEEPVSPEVQTRLSEAITTFYDLVSRQIRAVLDLGKSAALGNDLLRPVEMTHLELCTALNDLKVSLAIKAAPKAITLKAIPQLIDRLKQGVGEIRREVSKHFQCDPVKVIERVLAERSLRVGSGPRPPEGVQIRWMPPAMPAGGVRIEGPELANVIDNLLSNAERAVEQSKEKRIEIRTYSDAEYFIIEVMDTGCGIPQERWNEVFDLGFTTRPDSNSGFGLFYARKVLTRHGGSIEIKESEVGKGTTFVVKLRRA